jgi:predicted RNase H-like nuclease (RuvC/YqgF family)
MSKEKELNEPILDDNVIDEKNVSYETYSRVLGNLKKRESEKRDLLEKLQAFEAEQERSRIEKMEEEGKLKELNEHLSKRLEESEKGHEQLIGKIERSFKLQKVKESLPGKVINDEYLKFVNLDDIKMDDMETINPESLKMVVDKFVDKHSALIEVASDDIPSVQSRQPAKQGLTHAEWKKLPLKEMKRRANEVID